MFMQKLIMLSLNIAIIIFEIIQKQLLKENDSFSLDFSNMSMISN